MIDIPESSSIMIDIPESSIMIDIPESSIMIDILNDMKKTLITQRKEKKLGPPPLVEITNISHKEWHPINTNTQY